MTFSNPFIQNKMKGLCTIVVYLYYLISNFSFEPPGRIFSQPLPRSCLSSRPPSRGSHYMLQSHEAIFRPEDVSGLANLRNLTNLCVDHIRPGLVLSPSSSHIIHFTEALILSKEGHKRYCQLASYFLILFL